MMRPIAGIILLFIVIAVLMPSPDPVDMSGPAMVAGPHAFNENGRWYISNGEGWVWHQSFETKRDANRALVHYLNKDLNRASADVHHGD